MLFAGYDMFIANVEPKISSLFLVIELLSLVQAAVLFIWASILGEQIKIKPKHLRITASCILAFTILYVVGMVPFNIYILRLGAETNLHFLVIWLLNLIGVTLLFMWADILEKRN
jgi:hypothetical protein